MKCPQCGIHYDDGDKECPMCGARRPMFAKSTAAPAARSTAQLSRTTAGHKKRKKPASDDWSAAQYQTTTCAHPDPADCGHKSARPRAAAQKNGRKRNPIVTIIIIIILINVLPALLSGLFAALESLGDSVSGVTRLAVSEVSEAPVPDLPASTAPAEERAPFPYPGVYQTETSLFRLYDDGTYSVEAEGLTEWGEVFWWECEDADEYIDGDLFPFDEYRCVSLCLEPVEIDRDPLLVPEDYPADDESRFVSLYIDRETDEVYAVDDFDELFWFSETEQQTG